MSDSKNSRRGSFRGHLGREYWSARPGPRMADWGTLKRTTHKAERRQGKSEIKESIHA